LPALKENYLGYDLYRHLLLDAEEPIILGCERRHSTHAVAIFRSLIRRLEAAQ